MQNRLYNVTIDITDDAIKKSQGIILDDMCTFEEEGIIVSDYYRYSAEKNPLYMQIVNNTYKLSESDLQNAKFYRHANINIPRDKFNVLKEKYNSSVVLSRDTCDYEITSLKAIDSFVHSSGYGRRIKKSEILKKIKLAEAYFDKKTFENLVSKIQSTTDKSMFYLKIHKPYEESPLKNLLHKPNEGEWTGYKIITSENYNILLDMLNKGNIVFDDDLYPFINKHLYALKDEDYFNISKMLKASDEDRNLAMGMIANSDFQNSYDKVALLIYFNCHLMKECKNWNSTSFKVLRKEFNDFIGIPSINMVNTYDYLIKTLAKKKSLTQFSVNILLKMFFEHVSSSIFNHGHAFVIDINAIKLSDEFIKKVK